MHLGHFLDFLEMPGASRSTIPIINEQLEVPKYTEQDLRNAKDKAIKDIKRKIRDTIECPICQDIPSEGQIMQCQNGHLICERCMGLNNTNACPTCREPFEQLSGHRKIRALGIEQVIEAIDLDLSCKNANCEFMAPKRDLTSHEKRCEYRIVECPDTGCERLMPFLSLLGHIASRRLISSTNPHKQSYGMKRELVGFGANSGMGYPCNIHKFQNKLFASTFCMVNGIWYAYMHILGDLDEAKKFSVTISVGQGSRAGIICYGQVFPVDAKKADILKDKNGVLSFSPVGMAENFFQHIKREIWSIDIHYKISNAVGENSTPPKVGDMSKNVLI